MHQWRCGDESSHLLSNHLARRAPNRYIRLSLAWLYKPRKRVSVFFPFFPVKHHSAVNASGIAMSPFILDHWMTTTFEVLGWIFPFSSRDRQMVNYFFTVSHCVSVAARTLNPVTSINLQYRFGDPDSSSGIVFGWIMVPWKRNRGYFQRYWMSLVMKNPETWHKCQHKPVISTN